MAPYGQCARPRLQNSAGTIGALKLHIMSHRGHCEARRPGSKGHFLHRGGGATPPYHLGWGGRAPQPGIVYEGGIYYLIKIITAGKTVIHLALQEMLMEPI